MAVAQRHYGFKDSSPNGNGTGGSAEEDSMTESDMSSSPNSLMDYHAQTAQILLQYDTATGIFSESGLAKPVPLRRVSDKRLSSEGRTFTNNGGTYDNLSHIGGYPGETTLESNPILMRAITSVNMSSSRRQRSEKKPIPVEQKDNKYYERRRRNNYAAKKSRDYRKAREDEVALRASQLERENAVLKAQLSTLREEAEALKRMLIQKRQLHQQQQQHQQQQENFNRFLAISSIPSHIQV